jgi:hypothetical protein
VSDARIEREVLDYGTILFWRGDIL